MTTKKQILTCTLEAKRLNHSCLYAVVGRFVLWISLFDNSDRTTYNTTHTHTCLTALFPGLPRWAGARKVKPIWILLKQETVSGSGISWAICKSAPRSRQITTPAPYHSVFTGRMPFLPPNQQRQSTEGIQYYSTTNTRNIKYKPMQTKTKKTNQD